MKKFVRCAVVVVIEARDTLQDAMILTRFKRFIPNDQRPTRILLGPFRGAVLNMRRRDNLRKIFGLYEHVLNPWLETVLPRINTVLDVGANDGYFTFGCAAAFRRFGTAAKILAFEPSRELCEQLETSREQQPTGKSSIVVHQTLVGKKVGVGVTTLDSVPIPSAEEATCRALVKIDVEGAEVDVIEGASKWLTPKHHFLIEVHGASLVPVLTERFAAAGIKLKEYGQEPLFLLGGEKRVEDNRWLVTEIA